VTAIRGRPPTASEDLLIKAAASLGPDTSVENLNAAAKLILGNVVLVASVLTGFGLFTDVTARLREHTELLTLAAQCALASVTFALIALIPWLGKVDVDDLKSLRQRFKDVLLFRGVFVVFATIFLFAALFVASRGTQAYLAAGGPSDPNIVASRSNTSGESLSAIVASVTQVRAPTGSLAELVIKDAAGGLVHRATQLVGSTGDVKLEATVAKAAAGALTITYTLTRDNVELTPRRELALGADAVTPIVAVEPSDPNIIVSRSNTGGDLPTITASVTQLRAPSGSRAELTIKNAGATILHRAIQEVGSAGEVKLEATVEKAAAGALSLEYALTSGGRDLVRKVIQLAE
jgi:hypothetical protein